MTTTLNLDAIRLDSGAHDSREQGVCLMEAVAWYVGRDHSDMPPCVSPVLRRYGIRLNDALPDERRQELKRFIPLLVGTAGDGLDDKRQALARRVLMTQWLPQWLRLAGLEEQALKAEAAADLTGVELRDAIRAIRDVTWKARTERWEPLRAKVQEAVTAQIQGQGTAVADADAAADAAAAAAAAADAAAAAAADAAADAVADAAAVAVADADAAAAAAAVAVAVADADAAAVADAVADAAADAAAYWTWRNDLYDRVYKAVKERVETDERFAAVRALRATQLDQAVDLYERMIAVAS